MGINYFIRESGGYNTPSLGAEFGSRACPGVHTRDSEFFAEFLKQQEEIIVNDLPYRDIHSYIKKRAQTLGHTRRRQMIAAID